MKNSWIGPLALLLSAATFGSYGILIKLLGHELGATSQIVFRYGLAIVLLFTLIVLTKVKLRIPRKSIPLLGLFAILMQINIWCFTNGALQTTIPSLLGAFYIGAIVSGALLGGVIFREKLSTKTMVSTIIAIVGLYWLTKDNIANVGVLYGLAAGVLECATHSIRKYLTRVSRGMMAMVAMAGTLIMTVLGGVMSHQPFTWPSQPQTWFVGILFAILATLVNITLTYGFRSTPITWGSVLMATEILFGSLMGWGWLGVAPTTTEWVSNGLIVTAVVVQNLPMSHNGKMLDIVRRALEG